MYNEFNTQSIEISFHCVLRGTVDTSTGSTVDPGMGNGSQILPARANFFLGPTVST